MFDMFKRFVPVLLVVTVILAFIVGVLWQKVQNLEKGGKAAQTATPTEAPAKEIGIDKLKELFDKNVVKFGEKDSRLIFVEVSDPSCPYCHVAGGKNPEIGLQINPAQFKYASQGGSYVPPVLEMKKLVQEGKASYIYLYQNGHGNGEMATKALYCAFDQNKYWEAHNLLYTNKGYELINNVVKNDETKIPELVKFLKSAADADELQTCLESGKYDQRLIDEQALAMDIAISGTPGFYINTQRFPGAYNWEDMKGAVEEALK